MLRRAARAFRLLALISGLTLLLVIPASFYRGLFVTYLGGDQAFGLTIYNGAIRSRWFRDATGGYYMSGRLSWREYGWDLSLFPPYHQGADLRGYAALPSVYSETNFEEPWSQYEVGTPLWLLSAVCLAWPVTSFIIARRRHKRGFPVEPKGAVEPAVSTPLPRAGEVPSESASEAERV